VNIPRHTVPSSFLLDCRYRPVCLSTSLSLSHSRTHRHQPTAQSSVQGSESPGRVRADSPRRAANRLSSRPDLANRLSPAPPTPLSAEPMAASHEPIDCRPKASQGPTFGRRVRADSARLWPPRPRVRLRLRERARERESDGAKEQRSERGLGQELRV
jgi:hypothetical protein